MANTTTFKGSTIHIVLDAATDWAWNSSTEITAAPKLSELSKLGRIFVDSIEFDPNAAGDKISVRECALDGPIVFHASGGDTYDQRIKEFYGKPLEGIFIDKDDVTSNSSAASLIIRVA